MLLALWPLLFPHNNAHSGGTLVEPDVTHRAIRGKEVIKRTPAMIAAEEHLRRLQGDDDGSGIAELPGEQLDMGSIPDSNQPVGNAPVRVPRHEQQVAGRIPEALGASFAASDVIPFELNEAMRRFAAKQAADEDDEMAMIAIMMAGM